MRPLRAPTRTCSARSRSSSRCARTVHPLRFPLPPAPARSTPCSPRWRSKCSSASSPPRTPRSSSWRRPRRSSADPSASTVRRLMTTLTDPTDAPEASADERTGDDRARGPLGPRARKSTSLRRSLLADKIAPYTFLLPWLIGFFVITLGPMLYSLYLSFTDFSMLAAPEWVGFDNYIKLFTNDPKYLDAVRVPLVYVLVSVPLQLAFALAVAMVLNRGLRGLSLYRYVYYLPSLIGASVAVAVLWRQMFGS